VVVRHRHAGARAARLGLTLALAALEPPGSTCCGGKVSTFVLMSCYPIFLLTTNPHHAPLATWQHVVRDLNWVAGVFDWRWPGWCSLAT